MKILLIVLLIIIILYFVIIKISPFVSGQNLKNYPSPLPGAVLNNAVSWTSISDIPYDNSILTYLSTNSTSAKITCYNMNPNTTLNTTTPRKYDLPNQYDATIVNYYLSFDVYASAFMNNDEKVMITKTIIDVSKYKTETAPLVKINSQTVNGITTNYDTLSWDNVKGLNHVYLVATPTIPITDNVIIKKIKASVLYSLINLYYNPGNPGYVGLVNDLSANYPIDVTTSATSTPNASTMGITFRAASKHAVWIYLLARAQWINTTILGL